MVAEIFIVPIGRLLEYVSVLFDRLQRHHSLVLNFQSCSHLLLPTLMIVIISGRPRSLTLSMTFHQIPNPFLGLSLSQLLSVIKALERR